MAGLKGRSFKYPSEHTPPFLLVFVLLVFISFFDLLFYFFLRDIAVRKFRQPGCGTRRFLRSPSPLRPTDIAVGSARACCLHVDHILQALCSPVVTMPHLSHKRKAQVVAGRQRVLKR